MATITKSDLIDHIAATVDIKRTEAASALDACLDKIISEATAGNEIQILGFGKFSTSHRAERMARKPMTDEMVLVKAATLPKFKAGKQFKEAVNVQKEEVEA